MEQTQYTNYHLLIGKNRSMVQRQEPAETIDLDLIFLSRESVFQGTISRAKHERNVLWLAQNILVQQLNHATTYLSSACQHHAEITQSHTFSALIRLSTTTHTLLTSNTRGISNNSEKLSLLADKHLWTFLLHLSYSSSRTYSHTVGRPA